MRAARQARGSSAAARQGRKPSTADRRQLNFFLLYRGPWGPYFFRDLKIVVEGALIFKNFPEFSHLYPRGWEEGPQILN